MTIPEPDKIFLTSETVSKDELFHSVCQEAYLSGAIISQCMVVHALQAREKMSDTRISETCALAHCQNEAVSRSQIIVVDCHTYPISWQNNVSSVSEVVFLLIKTHEKQSRLKEIRSFVRELAMGSYPITQLQLVKLLK